MASTRLSLRYAALSDVGRVRKDNQDSGFASDQLLVVADGVGGAARGDIASSTAVQILRRLDAPAPDNMLEALAGAIHRTHDRIAELVEENPELEGTSTTVTAALFDGSRIGVGHVGDSRGYLLRNGELSQLTQDHTLVQSLIDEGRITEEESRNHPHRNLILRAVDGVDDPDPDLFVVELAPGDRVLLCSDGCSGVLGPDQLADILGTGTADYAAVELVRASLDAGSTDNVTCVVADVISADAAGSDGAGPDGEETSAAATVGPMLVGAAAAQSRPAGASATGRFRGHRGGDTDEMDPVPAEDDETVDPEVLRYAPLAPARFLWLRRLGIVAAMAAVLALIAVFTYRWTQSQYYVAADGGRVAIYQGVEADVPGLSLTSVEEGSDVPLAALSRTNAGRVRDGIVADDLADAREIVTHIGSTARVCPATPAASATSAAGSSDTRGQDTGDQAGQNTAGQDTAGQTSQQSRTQEGDNPSPAGPSPTGSADPSPQQDGAAGSPGDGTSGSPQDGGSQSPSQSPSAEPSQTPQDGGSQSPSQSPSAEPSQTPQGDASQSPTSEPSPTVRPPECVEASR